MRNKLFFLTIIVMLMTLVNGPVRASVIYVGIEDTALPGGDKDYQDIILTISGATLAGNYGWKPMVAPNYDGVPYFDGASYDGPHMGFMDFALGTGGFAGNPTSPHLTLATTKFWGSTTGSYDASTHFTSNGAVDENVLIEVSAWSGQNTLGWANTASLWLVNSLSADAGGSVSFRPGSDFVLVFSSPGGNMNQKCDGEQFAFLESDSAPEPASMALIGGGLLGLGFWRRRKKQAKQ
ncbi:PEP-CTERM sorting domain-containing protein [Candidatus Nomurabacteria bacterium]|nr:PEP-CTERM sorting domain-containing protein [Candidatus Nomurabacteria bacterium]